MEVHHHPHKPKNWIGYITEFLMLFTAVTLGFFAENVREHQVVIERKNQNLHAMMQDLKRDSAQLKERIVEYTTAVKAFEEMKFASYQYSNKQLPKSEYISYITQQFMILNVGNSFFCNNSAYKNTISTGSLSVIGSLKTKQLIAEYYEELGVKLLDNNRNLDADFNVYTLSDMQVINSLNSPVVKKYAKLNEQQLLEDYKSNPDYVAAILSPSFRLRTNKFEMRCDYYLYLMNRFYDTNQQLLAVLGKEEF